MESIMCCDLLITMTEVTVLASLLHDSQGTEEVVYLHSIFFMALSELERRFEKVKILSLGSLCHPHFLPTHDVCWDAVT